MTSFTLFFEMACQIFQKKQEEKQLEEEQAAKSQNWKLPVCYNDDDDEERSNSLKDNIISGLLPCSANIPNEPVLSTEEPDNSLSMGDEHLDTIPATKSDEVIKSSVENLIPIPSESECIPDHMCDVPFHDNSPPLDVSQDQLKDFSESNDEFSSINDDSFSFDKIDYVEASPLDSELVRSEVMEIVIPEVGGIDDDILREKLLNVNHLFAKIEASNDNLIPFYDPIISGTPLTLTPSGESDFFLEGKILLLEAFLNDDHSSDFKTKSSSTSLNSLLEKTNNFDNSLPEFTTFSNVLYDAEYESDSSDDQSCSDEDVLEKIISKPLFEEEIIPTKIDLHPDNAESDLLESLCTHDSSLLISSKIDSLLDEFAGELTLLKSIPPRIDETDCDFEGEIHLQTPSSGISILLAVGTPSTGSGNLYCQWELSPGSGNALCILFPTLCKMACQVVQKKLEEKQLEEERAAKAQNLKLPVCYDDDNNEERSDSLDDNIIFGLPPSSVITPDEPVLSTEEPDNSLSMGDEHLDTILATKSDEFIKSSVENLIPIPSESKGIPEHVCDVPSHDNSLPLNVSKDQFEDFSESNEEFSSNDDDSFSIDDIDYVEASPPDSELVRSEVMEIIIPEVDAFLAVEDEPTSSQLPKSYLDPEGDMLLFEAFLYDDHSSDFKTKSSSTSLNSLLEETNNFDNSLPEFTTFSNVLFDAEYESDSSDDQSCSNEDVLEKIVLKHLFEEEIIPMKIDQHPDNAKSDLMDSLRTHDSFLSISSKIDSLLDEFASELTLLKSIPPEIDETDCDFKKDIRLIEKLLYDNSSPRPPKEFVSVNSDAESESFSPSPILVKDSDSLMEEINLFCTPDYPMPLGIEEEDYDSERDILILKDLPSNNTLLFAEKYLFHFDIPSFSRPHAKPPDDTGILSVCASGALLCVCDMCLCVLQ
nr:hypothetical protein [Tanacetum cinerariifolium]